MPPEGGGNSSGSIVDPAEPLPGSMRLPVEAIPA
jgi:hypothetical protein